MVDVRKTISVLNIWLEHTLLSNHQPSKTRGEGRPNGLELFREDFDVYRWYICRIYRPIIQSNNQIMQIQLIFGKLIFIIYSHYIWIIRRLAEIQGIWKKLFPILEKCEIMRIILFKFSFMKHLLFVGIGCPSTRNTDVIHMLAYQHGRPETGGS